MHITVNGPHRSGIGYVREDNRIGMIQDDYKQGNSLNGVGTHQCASATSSDIPKVKSATMINQVEPVTTINYDEVVINKVGNDKSC